MCGIVGAVSAARDISPVLLEGLAALEYRGYDSAGMAVCDAGGAVQRVRAVGKVVELETLYRSQLCIGRMGIAHTRWATHGKPSEQNAHPHVAGDIYVVCNGIVDNHRELRQELAAAGHNFVSETDTESLAALIQHCTAAEGGDLRAGLQVARSRLSGAYSVVVMSPGSDVLLGLMEGCPLVLGVGDGEMFLASDPLAVARITDRFVFFEDGDLVVAGADSYQVEDEAGKAVRRRPEQRSIPVSQLDKGSYRHFTEKEIAEQPVVVQEVLSGRLGRAGVVPDSLGIASERLKPIAGVHLVACGSAYYAASIGAAWLEELAGVPARCWLGSEYRYNPVIVPPNTLFAAISQSGETADTLGALRRAMQLDYADYLAVCNVPDSMMARTTDNVLLTRAGREVSVLSTKAVMAQIVNLLLLALDLARVNGNSSPRTEQICRNLKELPQWLERVLALDGAIEMAAYELVEGAHAIFLGRGAQQQYIAAEGALKMKESAYIHAEAYAAGELKHGPLALVDEHIPVVAVLPHEQERADKMISNLEEVAARGGRLLLIGSQSAIEQVDKIDNHSIILPDAPPEAMLLMELVAVQLLAYHVARLRGTDVDQPRNLAKSVTVE